MLWQLFLPRWRNWPDYRRDYDLNQITQTRTNTGEEIDLITEGITTQHPEQLNHKQKEEEIDLITEGITTRNVYAIINHLNEEIDLITEGITTRLYYRYPVKKYFGRNWPDYRRDYDLFPANPGNDPKEKKKLTWLQKGLRPTRKFSTPTSALTKKLTWLQKGLRHKPRAGGYVIRIYEEIDLITEGITTSISGRLNQKVTLEEIDLITEGITTPFRRLPKHCDYPKKLTWLQKGLRLSPPRQGRLYQLGRNWPDYRRDYDTFPDVLWILFLLEEIDLITEGITTDNGKRIESLNHFEEIDLITEGITTSQIVRLVTHYQGKKLTWLQKGLRPIQRFRAVNVKREEIDLITEGITT